MDEKIAAVVDEKLYVIGGRDYSYSMRHLSAKSDYKSVISIPLSDLQITEDEANPDDDTTEEPKDQDGTKPGDGTTEPELYLQLTAKYMLRVEKIRSGIVEKDLCSNMIFQQIHGVN